MCIKKRLYFLFSCLLCCSSVKAQNWGLEDDYDAFHFMYTLQYVTSQYKVFPAANWQTPLTENGSAITPPLSSMISPVSSGFAIGLGVSKNISDHTEIRLVPTLTLADRVLTYGYHESIETTPEGVPNYYKDRKVKASLIELPLSLKLKSDRRHNFGAYLAGGVKYSADISSLKQNNDMDKVAFEKMLKNTESYLSYEAGIGFDLYLKYFKLSPEIKYSSSFNNILKQENNVFSEPIDRLMLRNITFSLYIQ